MKLSDFIAANWRHFRHVLSEWNLPEKKSFRTHGHLPSYTKRSKHGKRERNRIRNQMARLSRRINRRRAAG